MRAFEVAQHDGDTEALRQSLDLIVDRRPEVRALAVIGPSAVVPPRDHLGRPPFMGRSSGSGGPGAHGGAVGHLMQPGAQRVLHPERPGFADQDQEGRLERILGLMLVTQYRPASLEHDRPVPLDQGGKGELGRLAAAREPLQELAVGHVPDGTDVEKRAELPED